MVSSVPQIRNRLDHLEGPPDIMVLIRHQIGWRALHPRLWRYWPDAIYHARRGYKIIASQRYRDKTIIVPHSTRSGMGIYLLNCQIKDCHIHWLSAAEAYAIKEGPRRTPPELRTYESPAYNLSDKATRMGVAKLMRGNSVLWTVVA